MQIIITNPFTHDSTSIVGNPMEVEARLRNLFHPVLDFVPIGDLETMLDVVNRMHGVCLNIKEATDYNPPKRRASYRPTATDLWLREVDTDPKIQSI